MKQFNIKVVDTLTDMRDGNSGYYETMEKCIYLFTSEVISLIELDNALIQLRDDFARCKQFGFSNVKWEIL